MVGHSRRPAGVAGSIDLGAAAVVYSGSVTSDIRWNWGGWHFGLGNMAGVYRATSVSVGDYDIDYDLTNVILRNGLSVSRDLTESPHRSASRPPSSTAAIWVTTCM